MLPTLLFTCLTMLPICAGVIGCRAACRRCAERLEHPEMLEVYCEMCDECKDRKREWLDGAPSLRTVENNADCLTNYAPQDSQDCSTTPEDESCEQPQLLKQIVTTTTTTTTTTTRTTTTRKPCPTRPRVRPTGAPCHGIACAIPMAIPICPVCPMQMLESFYAVTPFVTSEYNTEPIANKLAGISSPTDLYYYLGVPKKFLKQFKLSRSRD